MKTKLMRSYGELEVGDLVKVGALIGTVVKKNREHVSNAGPELDVKYDILFPGERVQHDIPFVWAELIQEANT